LPGQCRARFASGSGGVAGGLRHSTRDVAPRHIRGVITFGELSRSPAEAPAA
jgi:hypothetical protein